MIQWLSVFAAPAEVLGSIPSVLMVFTTTCNSSVWASGALFCPPKAPGILVVHRHTCRENSCIHKIKMNRFKKFLQKRLCRYYVLRGRVLKWMSIKIKCAH